VTEANWPVSLRQSDNDREANAGPILSYVARFLNRPGQCKGSARVSATQTSRATDWEMAQFAPCCRRLKHLRDLARRTLNSLAQSRPSSHWAGYGFREKLGNSLEYFHRMGRGKSGVRFLPCCSYFPLRGTVLRRCYTTQGFGAAFFLATNSRRGREPARPSSR
jgi:hypothetical protein